MSFSDIAVFLSLAAACGILARILRQPLLIGYLFAGFLLAYFGLVKDLASIETLGKVGVTLLLFLVGLEMKISELPSIGRVAFLTGIGQIVFTSIIGFFLSLFLGFSPLASIYISVALTFSSTIIIVKLLSEKGDLGSLYGKIAVGFLLVQDFVAVLILMFLSGIGTGQVSWFQILMIGVKALLLLILVWQLSKKILPNLFERFINLSPEILFVVSIAWALGFAAFLGGPMGFSFEIGGFLAGLALSNLHEHVGIAAKTRPLRDFFLTIFFLTLGTQLLVGNLGAILLPALIFSVFVLVGNPLIVMIIMGFLRYKKRTSFLASVTVAQISEFSFILMAKGLGLGHVNQSEVASVIVTGIITMTASTYLILGSNKIYKYLKNYLKVFERGKTKEEALRSDLELSDHVVLIGAGRTGKLLIPFFRRKRIPLLVIDHNPKVFSSLTAEKIPILLGDVGDEEELELAKIDKARLVISTIADLSDNLILLGFVRKQSRIATTILKASSKQDAIKLYEAGANLVIIPEIMAGEYLRHIFVVHGIGEKRIIKMGRGHFERLMYF